MCVGAGDASDEDLPLFTLAERHANSPEPDAKGSSSSAEAAAVLEMHDHNKAPASSKANSEIHAEAGNSQAGSQNAGQSEAEISAAEATPAPGSQGSPEPSSAPPAAVQPRTTRSQSKRMSIDASPSISIASKQSIQAEPEGKPSLTKPPSGRRKRSITPAHPPAAAKASPPPAEAAGTAINANTASAGKKRQRTPDTATGAATKKAAVSRRSSRLSAIALTPASAEDLHHEEQDSDCRPLGLEVALPTTIASPAEKAQSNGGVQLVSAANAADDERQSAEAAAGMLSPTSDRTAPTDTTAVVLTDATPATAAGGNCTEATAEAVSECHVKPVEAVSAKQPHSPVPDSVGASAEMLHQTKQPTQADEPLLDQHQATSGAQSAAISKTAVSQESLAPASKGHAPTDGKDAEVAEASTAVVVSEDAGAAAVAADVPAQTPTDVAEGSLPCLVAPPMAAGELPTMEKAPVPSSAAAAAAPVANAYSIAQAANTELAAAREEAQAPISAAAAAPIGGVLAASTGLESAAKPVDTAAEQTDVTESCASADASGLQAFAPHASGSAAVPDATESSLPTDALATEVAEVTCAVPATASETKAEAVESVASARARPSLASSSAPTSSQVQSAESPAAATAAQATAAPPAAAAAAALATAAMLKTMSVPKPPQSSRSTRIGLPNRLSSLSKSLLGPAQQKAGSTHIRPILSKGLSTALKSDRGVKAPHLSLSEGRTGTVLCFGHSTPELVKMIINICKSH